MASVPSKVAEVDGLLLTLTAEVALTMVCKELVATTGGGVVGSGIGVTVKDIAFETTEALIASAML